MTDNATPKDELKGIERRLANLKPITQMSEDEKKEFARKGGIARGEQQKRRKTMKEQMLTLLEAKVSRETAVKYLGEDANTLSDEDLTCQGIMSAKMWQEASLNGNAKAAEFVRDTSGQRPKDQIELTAEVMTDNDRSLMADIAERLGIMPNKNSD